MVPSNRSVKIRPTETSQQTS